MSTEVRQETRIFEKVEKGALKGWKAVAKEQPVYDYDNDTYGSTNYVILTNYSDGSETKTSHKEFSTFDEALAFVEEQSHAKLKAKYTESDPGCPQMLLQELEELKEKDEKEHRFDCEKYNGKGINNAFDTITEIGLERLTLADYIPNEHTDLSRLSALKGLAIALDYAVEEFPDLSTLSDSIQSLRINFPAVTEVKAELLPSAIENLSMAGGFEKASGDFTHCRNLKNLMFEHTRFTHFPKNFFKLPIESFIAKNHNETHFPQQLLEMPTLKELSWEGGANLPKGVSKLESLESITLAKVSKEVFTMPNIREISSTGSYEGFVEFPESFPSDSKIKKLDLQKSDIVELPPALFQLPKLKHLDLYMNDIEEVPDTFLENETLEFFNLRANELEMSYSVMKKGVGAMKEFLRKQKEVEKLCDSGDLRKSVTVAPCELDEKERKKITTLYSERWKKFTRKSYGISEETLQKIQDFIYGVTDSIDFEKATDREKTVNRIDDMLTLFAPMAEWTFVDQRITSLFAMPFLWFWEAPDDDGDIRQYGLSDELFSRLQKEINGCDGEEEYLNRILPLVKAQGASDEQIVKICIRRSGEALIREDNSTTSVGRYLLENATADNMESLWKQAKRWVWSGKFVALFLFNKPELMEPFLPTLLEGELDEKDNGKVCLPHNELKTLCAWKPEAYRDYIKEAIAKSKNCNSCLVKTLDVLMANYPNEEELILNTIDRVLVAHSETLNKDHTKNLDFRTRWWDKNGMELFLEEIFSRYGTKVFPMVEQFIIDTKYLSLEYIKIALKHLGSDAAALLKEAVRMNISDKKALVSHFKKLFDMMESYHIKLDAYMDTILEKFDEEPLEVAQTMAPSIARALDEDRLFELGTGYFEKKKKDERLRGLSLLQQSKSEKVIGYLKSYQESEKNLDVREALFRLFTTDEVHTTVEQLKERVAFAEKAGWLKKEVQKWLSVSDLPSLYWKGGDALSEETVHYLLYRQFRLGQIAIDPEISTLYTAVDKEKSSDFALALLKLAMKNGGANAKNRFACVVAALLGDDRLIKKLEDQIYKKRSTVAVETLGFLATDKAFHELRKVIRFYSTKYPNVRGTAEEAISTALESRGITASELFEGIAPDYGFDGGFRQLNSVEGALFLTSECKYNVLLEGGKVQKSLPKSIDAKEKKELTALLKEIKASAKEYALDYEMSMINGRRWEFSYHRERFTNNGFLYAIGSGLLWGHYVAGDLKELLLFNKDRQLVTLTGETVQESGAVGIVHPLELTEEQLHTVTTLWKKEKRPAQPFAQLERDAYTAADVTGISKKLLTMFDETSTNSSTFKSRANKRQWRRGSVVDSGEVSGYYRQFTEAGIWAFIKLSGMPVQGYWDEVDIELRDLFFVPKGSVQLGSYVYDEPRNEEDERLISIDDLPPVVLSETLSDLFFITHKE